MGQSWRGSGRSGRAKRSAQLSRAIRRSVAWSGAAWRDLLKVVISPRRTGRSWL